MKLTTTLKERLKKYVISHRKAKAILLILATFFNPLGFDVLFALVMKWTGSYWITDIIFYTISISLFVLYFLLKKKENNKEL